MATERDIVSVWVREGCGAFDIVRDAQFAEMAAEDQFDGHARHDTPQTVKGRTAHAVVGIGQRADGVGDAALGQVGGVGEAQEVSGGEHNYNSTRALWTADFSAMAASPAMPGVCITK